MTVPERINSAEQRISEAAFRLYAKRGSSKISISELAEEAGVVRNTIYKHVDSIESLFERVSTSLLNEMNTHVVASVSDDIGSVARLAFGMRLYVKRAHDEPDWGRFIVNFQAKIFSLQQFTEGPVGADISRGLSEGRFNFRPEQLPSAVSFVRGVGLGAMLLVLDGHETWRTAGSNAAEFALKALGVPAKAAHKFAQAELPLFK